jgi:hypothetical protein
MALDLLTVNDKRLEIVIQTGSTQSADVSGK